LPYVVLKRGAKLAFHTLLVSEHAPPPHATAGTTGSGFRGHIDNVFVYGEALSKEDLDFLRMSLPQSASPTAGSGGYALSLSAARQHLVISDVGSLWGNLTQFTLALWAAPAAGRAQELPLVAKLSADGRPELAVSLRQEEASKLRVRLSGARAPPLDWTAVLARRYEDAWVHLTVTFDGGRVAVYEDGRLVGNTTWGGRVVDSGSPFLVGAMGASLVDLDSFYVGRIDELQVREHRPMSL
jgi:hypothetical protein